LYCAGSGDVVDPLVLPVQSVCGGWSDSGTTDRGPRAIASLLVTSLFERRTTIVLSAVFLVSLSDWLRVTLLTTASDSVDGIFRLLSSSSCCNDCR